MRQSFFIAIISAACILPLFGCSGPDAGDSGSGGDSAPATDGNTTSP